MLDLSRVRNYYVACGYTDLRRGIEGLAAIGSQNSRSILRKPPPALAMPGTANAVKKPSKNPNRVYILPDRRGGNKEEF